VTAAGPEFRAWVRTHHPDVGGDPAEFAAELDRRRAGGRRAGECRVVAEVTVFRSYGGLWAFARWARRRIRRRAA
jgi:hypothetical protein